MAYEFLSLDFSRALESSRSLNFVSASCSCRLVWKKEKQKVEVLAYFKLASLITVVMAIKNLLSSVIVMTTSLGTNLLKLLSTALQLLLELLCLVGRHGNLLAEGGDLLYPRHKLGLRASAQSPEGRGQGEST